MKKILIGIITAAAMAFASPYGAESAYSRGAVDSGTLGTIVGGIVGGVVGHQLGKGQGKTAATIGGAVLGAVLGERISREGGYGREPAAYREPPRRAHRQGRGHACRKGHRGRHAYGRGYRNRRCGYRYAPLACR